MHTKNSSLAAAGIAVALVAGCGSSAEEGPRGAAGAGGSAATGGMGGGADSGGTGGATGDAAAKTISVSGTLDKFAIEPPDAAPALALAGVQVCVWKRPDIPCAKSDNLGQYLLGGVPANSEIGITYELPGYLKDLTPFDTGTEDIVNVWTLAADADAKAFADVAGFTYPLGSTGMVFFRANGKGAADAGGALLSGAKATITPSSGVGPVYVDPTSLPDKSLTATSSGQWGVFANVAPGDVEITITMPGKTCTKQTPGWKSDTATARVPVIADYVVEVTASCE